MLVESWNIRLNFGSISVGGCRGQPMLLFWKTIDETQMSKPPECAASFFKTWRSILVGHFGLQSVSLWVETPCSVRKNNCSIFSTFCWTMKFQIIKNYWDMEIIGNRRKIKILSNSEELGWYHICPETLHNAVFWQFFCILHLFFYASEVIYIDMLIFWTLQVPYT